MKLNIYIRQSMQMLRENPLISSISIVGTALSIAMIMVVVLAFQIQFASYYPEESRDRMLYLLQAEVKTPNNWNRGGCSPVVLKECFYSLKLPEAATGFLKQTQPLSIPSRRMYKQYTVCYTDPGFWKVFSFRFLQGKPFTQADFDSGLPVAVISESMAKRLYGTTDVVGKPLIIDVLSYTICGVVADVSTAARHAYAEVWPTYTSNPTLIERSASNDWIGAFGGILLAKRTGDFDAVRKEFDQALARLNSTNEDCSINFFDGALTRLDIAMGSSGQINVDRKKYLAELGGVLLFLLLVPSLNLLGVTHATIRKRKEEMGVRKAFGATGFTLMEQVLVENGVVTLFGGVAGLLLSYLLLPICKEFMLQQSDVSLQAGMVFQPETFLLAFLFMLLLNLLSAGIPAWKVARQPVVGALTGSDEQ